MNNNLHPIIRIESVDGKLDRYIASFDTGLLDATFAVVFSSSITGAIALHRFADMIESQYGKKPELRISNDLIPVHNPAVRDILSSIGNSQLPVK